MKQVHRAKAKIIYPDLAFYIQELVGRGYTYKEIGDLTGLGVPMLREVGTDRRSAPVAWVGGIKLLDLYLMNCKEL